MFRTEYIQIKWAEKKIVILVNDHESRISSISKFWKRNAEGRKIQVLKIQQLNFAKNYFRIY